MTTTYTPEIVMRLTACLLEVGWVRGRHFNDVYTDADGNLCISHPTDWRHTPSHSRTIHRAFTICGLTTKTYEEWSAGDELDAETSD